MMRYHKQQSGDRPRAMSATTYNRGRVQRAFKMRGLSIRFDAVEATMNVLRREEDPVDCLNIILDELKRRCSSGSCSGSSSSVVVVTKQMLSSVVADLSRNSQDIMGESVQLLNAFQMPKLDYDPMRKQFSLVRPPPTTTTPTSAQNGGGWSLHGDAIHKVEMFIQRYTLVHQRILRQDIFRPKLIKERGGRGGGAANAPAASERSATCVITPVEALLGRPGIRTLLGTIVQVEEGRYYLEDTTAQVPLNLQNCEILSDGYITENSIVLIEGEYVIDNGILNVYKIGHPPSECRYDTIMDSLGFDKSNIFDSIPSAADYDRLRMEENNHGTDGMFVLLSDVYLDNPIILSKLEKLFEGFEDVEPLPIFVFMGNFSSKPVVMTGGGSGRGFVQHMKSLFDDLTSIILKFPSLATEAKFVFIPGPNDPPSCLGGGQVLPQGPIPQIFTEYLRNKVKNVTFASNPCRLRYFTKEIVFFRQSLIHKLGNNAILPLRRRHEEEEEDLDNNENDNHRCDVIHHAIKTIMDQGHLSPIPLSYQPIYWQYDHSLRLFPLPDALILADDSHGGGGGTTTGTIIPKQYCRTYLDCTIVNPGSFPANDEFNFVAFYPIRMDSSSSTNDDVSSSAVEFSQID